MVLSARGPADRDKVPIGFRRVAAEWNRNGWHTGSQFEMRSGGRLNRHITSPMYYNRAPSNMKPSATAGDPSVSGDKSESKTGLLRKRLVELVGELLAKRSITRAVSIDEPLTQAGLSSIDMVNLMLAVEAEFNIMIPAPEITPENFRSIASVEALIAKIDPRDAIL
jgi:acyl carrier protein